jgi:hypothetical protein
MVTSQENLKNTEDALVNDIANSDFVKGELLGESLVKEEPQEEKEEPAPAEEPQEEEEQEEAESSSDNSETEEEDDDDEQVIAKSSVDKRFARMSAQIKALELENQSLKENQNKQSQDPQMAKLEAMSETELENLYDQIENAKYQKIKDEDQAGYNELVSLSKKVNKAIRTAPGKFVKQQEENYQKAANQVMNDPELELTEDLGQKIISDAQAIYNRTPSLKKSVTGQAEALLLAAEKAKTTPAPRKVVDKESKRAINKLKKKTSLDGKVLKSDMSKKNLQNLKKRAKVGDDSHKLDFAIQSGMLGDVNNLVDAI